MARRPARCYRYCKNKVRGARVYGLRTLLMPWGSKSFTSPLGAVEILSWAHRDASEAANYDYRLETVN